MKRRVPLTEGNYIPPALPATSDVLRKLPQLREFITATTYEDGSVRVPGDFALRNRGTGFEVTLYDPDAGLRLPCRGSTIDDAFMLAEKLLGVEDAPWEVDDYLTQRLAKRKARKKGA